MIRIKKVILIICCFLILLGCSNNHDGLYRLLIYYGTPKGINHTWNDDRAARIFANYDYIVFGEALVDPNNAYHESTISIISKIRKRHPAVHIFGYINLDMLEDKLPLSMIENRMDRWKVMGVDGIFLDCVGYDYQVTRERQNAAIRAIHQRGMNAFVNAWDPDDVMGNKYDPVYNPSRAATRLKKGDFYLVEKFLLPYDVEDVESPSLFSHQFTEKMDKVRLYRQKLGVKILSVSRLDYSQVSEDALIDFFHMNEATAGVFSLDGYGVSSVEYSASPADADQVVEFPYMNDYMKFYSSNEAYSWSEEKQQFARRGFKVESRQGHHDYDIP